MHHRSSRIWTRASGSVALAILVLSAPAATAATPRQGFTSTIVVSGLSRPTAMAMAPDGRIFVAEQDGALRVIRDGVLLPEPFLRVTVNSSGERGLLGVALDPFFVSTGYVYVYYTAVTPTVHNRVSRFTAAGDVAVAGSEVPLLDLPTLAATNHNGGAIHFGPDGFLYIGVGENAIPSHAQSLGTPLGKMLRIARDGSVPVTNPFVGQTTGINRAIWALGLRNPFTFAFDPWSGRLLINDVGQNAWEEINEGFPGANYGWPHSEGPTNDPAHIGPLYAYTHAATGGCAIAGGAFYPVVSMQFPAEYAGDYFFADLCGGWIRQLDLSDGIVAGDFVRGIAAPVGLAIGIEGALYYLARGAGASTGHVGRIDFTGTSTPPFRRPPAGTGSGRTAIRREAPARSRLAVPRTTSAMGQSRQDPRTMRLPPVHAEERLPGAVVPAGHMAPAPDVDHVGPGAPAVRMTPGTATLPDHGPASPAAAGPARFQTAGITPAIGSRDPIHVAVHDDGWVNISGATLRQLIELASGLAVSNSESSVGRTGPLVETADDGVPAPLLHIANAPPWIDSDRFTLEAYAGTGSGPGEVRRMLHTLLRERFRLVARFSRNVLLGAPEPGTALQPSQSDGVVLTIERVEQPLGTTAPPQLPGADTMGR